ncbi:DUF2510 domain-containing protein [Leifsonia sp. McL0607]|uniref:DUF2510 domain-containing protein n=1 Tax=Leifsonia sp. McL0607 TaxID=3415672 RepID=UPI003CF3E3AD
MSQLPPPGWYPDADSSYQRWWDGQRWTDALQVVPPSAPVLVEPRNGLATTALVGGAAAAFVTAFGVASGFGLDPMMVMLIVVCSVVAIGWGIAGLARAQRLQPHLGRARAIGGLCLGVGSVLLVVLLLAMVFTAGPVGGGITSA